MSEGQTAPNLKALEDNYEILGELRSGDRVGTYLAKRREDGADVIVTVVQAPTDGANNALNHFAADTQLLSNITHAQIPQVIEGRWVGKDQFAVVSRRYQTETLDELLARHETYAPPRIAMILGEVDSVLEWARANGVVHRGITPDTLQFETGTNRVLVTLEPTPIPIDGVPDAAADAKTIGTLAWAMLTGQRYADGQSLAELRPGLAKRVTDDTEAMVRSTSGTDAPDVPTYLAVVAAADALRAGELEIAEMQAELLEARRNELETFAAEQRACALRNTELEEQLANERKEFERKMADEEAELASVKSDFADLKSKEEGQLAAERSQFEHEREDLERDRADFEQRVAEREADLAAKHADVDRIRAEEGSRIDAAIAAAVQTVADTAVVVPPPEPEEFAAGAERPATAPEPWIDETVKKHSVGTGQPAVPEIAASGGRPGWLIPVAAAALIVVLVAIFAVTHRSPNAVPGDVLVGKSKVVPTPPTTDVRTAPRGGFLTQTAGGSVAQPAAGPPLSRTAPQGGASSAGAAATPAAPAAIAATSADSAAKAAALKGAATPKPKPRRATADSLGSGRAFSAEADAIRRAEAARRDSIAAARRDTTVRRDTVVPPPDTLNLAMRD
jgi:hypothetical protein